MRDAPRLEVAAQERVMEIVLGILLVVGVGTVICILGVIALHYKECLANIEAKAKERSNKVDELLHAYTSWHDEKSVHVVVWDEVRMAELLASLFAKLPDAERNQIILEHRDLEQISRKVVNLSEVERRLTRLFASLARRRTLAPNRGMNELLAAVAHALLGTGDFCRFAGVTSAGHNLGAFEADLADIEEIAPPNKTDN